MPPYPKDYSPKSLGPRPAAGLYVRHVKELTLKNFEITFDQPDQRPALSAYDVDGLTLDGFKAPKVAGVEMLRLQQVRNLDVHDSPGLADSPSR